MFQKSFLSPFCLLDPIASKKNYIVFSESKFGFPLTIVSGSALGWKGGLGSAREALRWRGGEGGC